MGILGIGMASAVDGFLLLNLKPHSLLPKPTNFSLYFGKRAPSLQIRADSMATERLGIKVEKNPPESKLTQLGVRQWPKYFDFSISFLACFSSFNSCNVIVSAPKLLLVVAVNCPCSCYFHLSEELMNVDK